MAGGEHGGDDYPCECEDAGSRLDEDDVVNANEAHEDHDYKHVDHGPFTQCFGDLEKAGFLAGLIKLVEMHAVTKVTQGKNLRQGNDHTGGKNNGRDEKLSVMEKGPDSLQDRGMQRFTELIGGHDREEIGRDVEDHRGE